MFNTQQQKQTTASFLRKVTGLLLVLVLLPSAAANLTAQYSQEAYEVSKASDQYDQRGFAQNDVISVDGKVVVGNTNAALSYSYPISSFTRDGYPLNVSLNYCNSVEFTTFNQYSSSWAQYKQNKAAWIIGLNGFAVQVLATTTHFANDPDGMSSSSTQEDYYDADFIWHIRGYDYCNRMDDLNDNDDQDVIHILRADGGVLTLRNARQVKHSTASNLHKEKFLYTGYYYEHGVNTQGYATVEINEDAWQFLHTNYGYADDDWVYAPRIVRYYPGDGLEYVFYENVKPFGMANYQGLITYGNKLSGPTIFYLTEINGTAGKVTDIEYDRAPDDLYRDAAGRTTVRRFWGHDFSYHPTAVTIESLGRTYRAWYKYAGGGTAARGSAMSSGMPMYADGLYGQTDPYSIDSQLGYIWKIEDPEERRTTFQYEYYVRRYTNFGFPRTPDPNDPDVTVHFVHHRLKQVDEPTTYHTISYRGPTDTTFVQNAGTPITSYETEHTVQDALNNRVNELKKYTQDDELLTTAKYSFEDVTSKLDDLEDSLSNHDSWLTKVELTDNRESKTATMRYSYTRYDDIPQPFSYGFRAPWLSHTELKRMEEERDTVLTVTDYDHVQLSARLIKPKHTLTHREKLTMGGGSWTSSKVLYDYEVGDSVPTDFDGDTLLLNNEYGKLVTQRTEIVLRPDNNDTVRTVTKDLLSLWTRDTTMTQTFKSWNKFAALAKWRELEASGNNPYTSFHQIDTFDIEETVNTTVRAAYIYGLPVRETVRDGSGTIIGGRSAAYSTWFNTVGNNILHRGALLADSVIGSSDSLLLNKRYEYSDGIYRNLPAAVYDANGGVTKLHYHYDDAPEHIVASTEEVPQAWLLRDDETIDTIDLSRKWQYFEKPIAEDRGIRKPGSGSPDTDWLTTIYERTWYGLVGGSVDPNGWYSRYEYDKIGRLNTAWAPGDFPSREDYTVELEGVFTEPQIGLSYYVRTIDTLYCGPQSSTRTHAPQATGSFVDNAERLRAARPFDEEVDCYDSTGTAMARKRDKSRDDAVQATIEDWKIPYARAQNYTITYVTAAEDDDLLHAATRIDSCKFRAYLTAVEGKCVTLQARMWVPMRLPGTNPVQYVDTLMILKNYTFNCRSISTSGGFGTGGVKQSGSDRIQNFTDVIPYSKQSVQPQWLNIRIEGAALDSILALPEGKQVRWEFEVMSYGHSVEFANNGDDFAAHYEVGGKFDYINPYNDYTLRYDRLDGFGGTTDIYAKVDDSLHTHSYVGSASHAGDNNRWTKVRHTHAEEYRVVQTESFIGNPDSPTRRDTMTVQYSGLGQVTFSTDPLGNSSENSLDYFGRIRERRHEDSSTSYVDYDFGNPPSGFSSGWQNFYGCMFAETTTDEEGRRNAALKDVFGRVRREIHDLDSLQATTYYEYELARGLLTLAINPAGDSTEYDYDLFGRVRYKSQPDLGTVSYAYDNMGRMRFSQTQTQNDTSRIGFYQYDDLGRLRVVGEAELLDVDTTGLGEGGEPIQFRKRRGPDALATSGAYLNRMTDVLDPRRINNGAAWDGVMGYNSTLSGTPLGTIPTFWSTLDSGVCLTSASSTHVHPDDQAYGPYLRHLAQHWDTLRPAYTVTAVNFEDAGTFPEFLRTVIHYDTLPAVDGAAFRDFPIHTKWNALAPHGLVRNLKGRESAVAYRQHSGQPWHYVVMSYDERGRMEALMRYTENLGFDAVYYEYNSLNQVISVRSADPIRQHSTWYGYDWNGRVDSVWSDMGAPGSGLGVTSPAFPALPGKPSTVEIVYDFAERGEMSSMQYPQIGIDARYVYDARLRTDSIVVKDTAQELWRWGLTYDNSGQINSQSSAWWNLGPTNQHSYSYDGLRRITNWTSLQLSANRNYEYDIVGNRTLKIDGVDSTTYSFADPVGPNRLSGRSTATHSTTYTYTQDGAMRTRYRVQNGCGACPVDLDEQYGYDMHGNLTEFATLALFNEHVWRYRHSPSGEREQKRVYEEPQPDNNGRAYLWVYYQLAGSRQLAVWNGLQTHDTSCGSGSREVWLYATEYLTYGLGDAHALSFKPNGGKRYKIADHLGSTRMVIDENGVIRSQFEYAPFGEQVANYGTSMNAPRKGFIDKEQDVENNLSDFSARKFDEELGRFTSVDVLWEEYRSLSPYHYANNNPLIIVDRSGREIKFVGTEEQKAELSSLVEELRLTEKGKTILTSLEQEGFVVKIRYAALEDNVGEHEANITGWRFNPNGSGEIQGAEYKGAIIKLDPGKLGTDRTRGGDGSISQVVSELGHELFHATQAQEDPNKYIQNREAVEENKVGYNDPNNPIEGPAFEAQAEIFEQHKTIVNERDKNNEDGGDE